MDLKKIQQVLIKSIRIKIAFMSVFSAECLSSHFLSVNNCMNVYNVFNLST